MALYRGVCKRLGLVEGLVVLPIWKVPAGIETRVMPWTTVVSPVECDKEKVEKKKTRRRERKVIPIARRWLNILKLP